MDYTITISLTDDQAAVLTEIAAEAGKTPQQVLDELGVRITDQVEQWIKDRCNTEFGKQDPAGAYLKLKGQKS